MGAKPTRPCGQVVMEMVIALPFLLLVSGLALDLVRCAQYRMVFHHVACLAARHQTLGGAGGVTPFARQKLAVFFGPGFPAAGQLQILEPRQAMTSKPARTVLIHYRYPQFFSFPLHGGAKHHMEVSARCSFPIG